MTPILRWTLIAVGAIVALILPLVLPASLQTAYVFMLLQAIIATGLVLLMGAGGQVSLGQGAFYGIGAVTAGALASAGVPPLAAFAAAPIVAAVVALLLGAPLLRLRGHYLAFGTLAVHILMITLVDNVDLLGGVFGIQGVPYLGVGDVELKGTAAYSYVALALLGTVLVITHNLLRSRFGRGLRALAASEALAAASGVAVGRSKVTAFAISAAYAGVAGAVMAFFVGFVSASSFPVTLSIQLVVMVAVGGVVSLFGGLVGAVVVTVLVQTLALVSTMPGMPPTAPAILTYAVYAIVLVVVLLFLPRGVVGGVTDLMNRVRLRGKNS